MNPIPEDLQGKLNSLVQYLDELEGWLESPEESLGGRGFQRIIERMFQLIVECAADAGDLWLQAGELPTGESVRGVFERLGGAEILDQESLTRFAEYVTIRNRIVHDYEQVNLSLLSRVAPALVRDGRMLAQKLLGLGPQ